MIIWVYLCFLVVQVLQPGSTTGGSNSNGGGSASTNSALPSNSIRAVEGEPRLFTRQIRRFVQNAVNNLSGNGNANSATSSTSANNLSECTIYLLHLPSYSYASYSYPTSDKEASTFARPTRHS